MFSAVKNPVDLLTAFHLPNKTVDKIDNRGQRYYSSNNHIQDCSKAN